MEAIHPTTGQGLASKGHVDAPQGRIFMIQGREIIDFLKKRTGVGTGTPAGQYAPVLLVYLWNLRENLF